jgi:pimeloyl-ACP methyl ester carboxylesterase
MDAPDAPFRHAHVRLDDSTIHVVEAGATSGPAFLFLHGWPQSWHAWQAVMRLAAPHARAVAIDLPGIGESISAATDGSKRHLAEVVHALIARLELEHLTLVGQDVGGMIVYPYLRAYQDIARAAIMDVVIPGLDPWDEVLRNPHLWHFALHAIPDLPEALVQGRQAVYFDWFYTILSADPAKITPAARAAYVAAYADARALRAGFDWYRAFPTDAEDNQRSARGAPVSTPVLYVRGEREGGDIARYVDGLRSSGVQHVEQATIPAAGHFTQDEAPTAVWQALARFAGLDA